MAVEHCIPLLPYTPRSLHYRQSLEIDLPETSRAHRPALRGMHRDMQNGSDAIEPDVSATQRWREVNSHSSTNLLRAHSPRRSIPHTPSRKCRVWQEDVSVYLR